MQHSDEQRKAFGSRLADARYKAGLSQEAVGRELAYKAGKKTVSQWETGRGVPDSITLRRLCRLYSCSADSLLWEKDADIPGAALPADLARRLGELDEARRAAAWGAFRGVLDAMMAPRGPRPRVCGRQTPARGVTVARVYTMPRRRGSRNPPSERATTLVRVECIRRRWGLFG